MKKLPLTAHTVSGVLLCALGLFVLGGWATGSEAMVRIVPGSAAMGINTAFLLIVSGFCLAETGQSAVLRICRLGGEVILIVLPLVILAQHLFNVDLTIDLADLHSTVRDGNPYPGRVPPNTTLCFLLAGISLMLMRRRGERAPRAVVWLTAAILAIGVLALLGFVLNLDLMYRFASYNRMSVPASLGMITLGFGLLSFSQDGRARSGDTFHEEERRITRLAGAMLTVLAVVAGLSGFAVLRQGFEQSTLENSQKIAENNAAILSNMLDQALLLSASVVTRPALHRRLVFLSGMPKDRAAREGLGEIAASMLALGFSGVQFYSDKGVWLVSAGRLVSTEAVVSVPLSKGVGGASLLWQNGFVLRTEAPAVSDGRIVGKVVMEQRLDAMTRILFSIQRVGRSNDMLLCGLIEIELTCFPSRLYAATRFSMFGPDGHSLLAVSRAILGTSGSVMADDLRGVQVLAGFAPLEKHSLGVELKVDASELYAPLRNRFNQLAVLLLIFVACGAMILRWQLRPMIGRIFAERRRMSVILENSNDAFVAIDHRGIITDWNAQAEKTFGWPRGEAIGASLASLIIPEDQRAAHNAGFARFARSGKGPVINTTIEVNGLHRSGREIPIELSIAAVHDGHGYVANAFLRDITERRAAQKRLADSENRYRILAETAPEIVWSGTLWGGITYINSTWTKIMGVPESAAMGHLWQELLHPDDRDRTFQLWREAQEKKTTYSADFRLRIASGEYRHFMCEGAPVFDANGRIELWVGINTDVSKMKEMQAELMHANKELESFSYSVSHDLRAPLQAIEGFSHVLLSDFSDGLDSQARKYLGRIQSSSKHMANLIDDMLALARLSRSEFHIGKCNLSALCELVIQELREIEPERAVKVVIQPGIQLMADPRLMRVALTNLIGNAWKFTRQRADAEIHFGTHMQNGVLTYFIRDNGAGFDMRYANNLFGLFQRLHSGKDFPGTGVGLATVQRVIHRHHGKIWADARLNAGATFYFTIDNVLGAP